MKTKISGYSGGVHATRGAFREAAASTVTVGA